MLFLKKILIVTLLTIFFVSLALGIYLNYHYAYNMPRNPQPEFAREYPLNVHGTIVYLTKQESTRLDCLYAIMMFSGLGGAALYIISKRRSRAGQNLGAKD